MKATEEFIWDYLDGRLDKTARTAFENELQTSPELRTQLAGFQQLHRELAEANTLQQPSPGFVHQVMQRISNRAPSVSRSFMLLGFILLVTTLAVVLLSTGVFDVTTHLTLDNKLVRDGLFKQSIPELNINGRWIISVIILLNSALVLVVIDRAILKPWFERRRLASH